MRRIAILDAPSNLGLRPPTATSVPGCAKAPGALRDHGLLDRLQARDAGCLTPPRYDPGDWRPGDGVCHAEQINAYSRRLADRIAGIMDAGEFPVILGGDCSIVIGSGLAMHRLGAEIGGRIGLVFVDGHSDFRHPGNASYVGAAAGEDLALVTGRGQADLAAIEGRRPYFRDIDVVVMGIRAQDEYRLDLQAAGIITRPVPALRAEGAARSAQWARDQLVDCAGYWVHVDMDVLDPAVMPAVDAPSPGGIAFPELELLLAGLVATPDCLGVEITVFDPDYDHDGSYAAEIVSTLVAGLSPARTAPGRPDLSTIPEPVEPLPTPVPPSDPVAESAAAWAATQPTTATEPTAATPLLADTTPAAFREPSASIAADSGLDRDPADLDADLADPDVEPAKASLEQIPAESDSDPAAADPGLELPEPVAAEPEPASEPADLVAVAPDHEEPAADAPAADEPSPAEPVTDEPDPLESSEEPEPIEPSDQAHPADTVPAQSDPSEADVEPEPVATTEPEPAADPEPIADADPEPVAEVDPEPEADLELVADADSEPVADADPEPVAEPEADAVEDEVHEPAARLNGEPIDQPTRPIVPRPLGSAPLLDSEPLPATRPGMLRPRPADDTGFSLPAQRPAFDLGSGEPADIT